MKNIKLVERTINPTTADIDNHERFITMPVLNGVVCSVTQDSIPDDFKPSRVIITTETTFRPPVVSVPEIKQYADAIKVYDANGMECHPTREIFNALGVSDSKNFARAEDRLKASVYKDTGRLKYVDGVDYIDVCNNTSNVMTQAVCIVPDPTNPITLKDNNNVLKTPPPTEGGSSMYSVTNKGGQGRSDTVWTTDAAKRIALSSNTEAGVRYANELINLEHQHGTGNTDILEHLVELNNDSKLPVLPTVDGYARVEDATAQCDGKMTHRQSCAIGKLCTTVTKASGLDVRKVNSSKYPTAYVNSYPEDIVVQIVKDLGYDYNKRTRI